MPESTITPTVIPTATKPASNGSGILPHRPPAKPGTVRSITPASSSNPPSKPASKDVDVEMSLEDFSSTTTPSTTPSSTTPKEVKVEPAKEKEEVKIDGETTTEVDETKVAVETDFTETQEPVVDDGEDELPDKRDYSGFSEDQVKILKGVRNSSFEAVKKIFKDLNAKIEEATKLKEENDKISSGRLPDYYHEHPDAYMLSKDFGEISYVKSVAEYEHNFYTEQLIRIKQGQPFEVLKVDKDGNYSRVTIPSLAEGKVDFKAEVEVQKAIQDRLNRVQQCDAELGKLRGSYGERHKAIMTKFEEIDNQLFGAFKDESKLPEDAKAIYKRSQEFADKNIPEYSKHPLMRMLVKAATSDIWKNRKIARLEKEIAALKSKKEDSTLAGPSSRHFKGTKSSNNGTDKEYSIADFQED